MRALSAYFQRQVDAIAGDAALRIYGSLLAFLQVLSAIYWLHQGAAGFLARGSEAICWPLWENCESGRFLGVAGTQAAIVGFLILGIAVMALFARARWGRTAYIALLGLNVLKLLILALDFRLRMNHHIMAFWATAAFLFLPRKRHTLRVLVALFYFWAGLLKLNSEWLSGSALYGHLWFFEGAGIAWACTYVVVLETILIWGLWLDGTWVAWAVWAQLVIFHSFSFPIVGFFYPLLMYALLMIYPLCWRTRKDGTILSSLFQGRDARATVALAALFSFFQIQSKLMPGDTALTGEGRLFALHMFDARTQCEAIGRIKTRGQPTQAVNLRIALPIRLHCDPIVYVSRARRLCRHLRATDPLFLDLDLSLHSRRSNAPRLQPVLEISDFCSKEIHYSPFWTNAWIRKDTG